jgi:hypothetical protein
VATEDFGNIADGGRDVGRAAEDFGEVLRKLDQTVTTDNPWGADEPGTAFGVAYKGVLGHAMETLGSHVDLLTDSAEKLATWADNSRQAEQHNAETAARADPCRVEV